MALPGDDALPLLHNPRCSKSRAAPCSTARALLGRPPERVLDLL